MLDKYFRFPIIWDYSIAILFTITVYYGLFLIEYTIPKFESISNITTDLSNISITSSGFILTLLTLLITFKSSSKINKNNIDKSDTIFSVFFISSLYFETIKHLKNAIKSLIFISLIGFSLKIGINDVYKNIMFLFNILALIIVVITLWRCLLILTKILEMQKEE